MSILCPYCGIEPERVHGRVLYPNRPDLWSVQVLQCRTCGARVGCHPNGQPKGTLADEETRAERMWAHNVFDPLHRRGYMTRSEAYRWLQGEMELSEEDCHIAKMTAEQCRKVIKLCNEKEVECRHRRKTR